MELKQKREAAIAAADKQLKNRMSRSGNSRSARLAGVAASGNLYRLAQEQRQKREAVLAKADEDVRSFSRDLSALPTAAVCAFARRRLTFALACPCVPVAADPAALGPHTQPTLHRHRQLARSNQPGAPAARCQVRAVHAQAQGGQRRRRHRQRRGITGTQEGGPGGASSGGRAAVPGV